MPAEGEFRVDGVVPRLVIVSGRSVVEQDLSCPDCGASMALVAFAGKVIYKCIRHTQTGCQGCHGAHPDGRPMGTPAPWPVRAERKKAHRVFDLLWNGPGATLSRDAAYRWLQGAMQMTPDQAHISRFDAAQCARVLELVRADFGLEPEPIPGEGQDGFFEVTL